MMPNADWMIAPVAKIRGVRHVIALSGDGLLMMKSDLINTETAERLAARCAGLQSLGMSQANEFGTDENATVRQVMVEHDGGFLFVQTAAEGASLAVVTGPTFDPAIIAQTMREQVNRIGKENFSAPARQDAGT